MKVLCSRDRLREALSIVGSALPTRTTKPVLEAVLLEAADQSLTLTATDLEVAVRYEIRGVQVERKGSCLVPAREASEFVRDLGDETVTLEAGKSALKVFGKDDLCELALADVGEFPALPEVDGAAEFTLPAAALALMVNRSAFAAARELGRFAMNGVRLEVLKDRIRLVATDGRRLSLVEQPLERDGAEATPVTIPTKAVQQFCRVTEGAEGEVTVSVGQDRIAFRSERATVISRLLEGEFPRYQAVIPKEGRNHAECDVKLLAQKLRLVSHLSAPEQPIVRLKFTGSSLTLSASSPQRGEARAELPVQFTGTQDQISFNPEFVLDGLKTAQKESIRLEFTDRSSPGKFLLNEHHEYVVMPVVNE